MIVLVSRMDSVVSLCSGSEARLDLRVLHWQAMGASYLLRKTFTAAMGLINSRAVRKCACYAVPQPLSSMPGVTEDELYRIHA